MISYIKHIIDSAVTIFDGLTVTFSYLFQRPITVQYPNKVDPAPETIVEDGYRGLLDFADEKCTACELCIKACPIGCIYTAGVKIPGRRGKAPVVYTIDLSKCMFCGLCVDACATDALFFTKEFEGASFQIQDLIRNYVPADVGRQRIEEGRKAKAEAEAEKARAEAEKRRAEAEGATSVTPMEAQPSVPAQVVEAGQGQA